MYKLDLEKAEESRDQIANIYWLPGGSDGKASACNAGDPGLIPGSGRSPGEGNGNPLQYSCLENSMDVRSPVGYSPWGSKESDTTKRLHFHWILEKARNSRKTSASASLTTLKPLTVWITTHCGKFFRRWEYQTTLPAS